MRASCVSTRSRDQGAGRSASLEQRILRETALDDLPQGYAERGDAVVRVQRSKLGSCSGALIGPRHVVTAQHCVVQLIRGELTFQHLVAGDVHVELGGDYLPWGRVGVRDVVACPGWTGEVANDIAVLVLNKPVPEDVPRFSINLEARGGELGGEGTFELAGFGSNAAPRSMPFTDGWLVQQSRRHDYRGPAVWRGAGEVAVIVPAAPGDSGGPILDASTGKLVAIVSHGGGGRRTSALASGPVRKDDHDDDSRAYGTSLTSCRTTIALALTR